MKTARSYIFKQVVFFRVAVLVLFLIGIKANVFAQTIETSTELKPLEVGRKLPDDFWTRRHLFYVNGDTVRKTLDGYKGKLIIVDFWATWCGICWEQMSKNEQLVASCQDEVILLLVDTKSTNDTYEKIAATDKKYLKGMGVEFLETIFDDTYFQALFPVSSYPKYMWISPSGHFVASTTRNSVTKGHIDGLLQSYDQYLNKR